MQALSGLGKKGKNQKEGVGLPLWKQTTTCLHIHGLDYNTRTYVHAYGHAYIHLHA